MARKGQHLGPFESTSKQVSRERGSLIPTYRDSLLITALLRSCCAMAILFYLRLRPGFSAAATAVSGQLFPDMNTKEGALSSMFGGRQMVSEV